MSFRSIKNGVAQDLGIAALIDNAPETLNTLNELAAALGDDADFATTISGQIGAKADATAVTALESQLDGKLNAVNEVAQEIGSVNKIWVELIGEKYYLVRYDYENTAYGLIEMGQDVTFRLPVGEYYWNGNDYPQYNGELDSYRFQTIARSDGDNERAGQELIEVVTPPAEILSFLNLGQDNYVQFDSATFSLFVWNEIEVLPEEVITLSGATDNIQSQIDSILSAPEFSASGKGFLFSDYYPNASSLEAFLSPDLNPNEEVYVYGSSYGLEAYVTRVLAADSYGGTYFEAKYRQTANNDSYDISNKYFVAYRSLNGSYASASTYSITTNPIISSNDNSGVYGGLPTRYPYKLLTVDPNSPNEIILLQEGMTSGYSAATFDFSDIFWAFGSYFVAVSTTGQVYYSEDDGQTWIQSFNTNISNAKITSAGEGGYFVLMQFANSDYSQVKIYEREAFFDPNATPYYTNSMRLIPSYSDFIDGYYRSILKINGQFEIASPQTYGFGIGGIQPTDNIVAVYFTRPVESNTALIKAYIYIYDSSSNRTLIKTILFDSYDGFNGPISRSIAVEENSIPGKFAGISRINNKVLTIKDLI